MFNVVAKADLDRARHETGWTETRTMVVGELWNAGVSAKECAAMIGGTSRNGVIGIVHRKKLDRNVRKMTRRSRVQPSDRTRMIVVKPVMQKMRVVEPQPAPAARPAPPIIDAAIPAAQRRQLVDLDKRCCRWPVGEPGAADFFFCGAPTRDDMAAYCASHMARAKRDTPTKAGGVTHARR